MFLGETGFFCFISQLSVEYVLEHQQKTTPANRPRGNAIRIETAHANTSVSVFLELEVEPEFY